MSDSRREIAEIKARPMCGDGKTPGMSIVRKTILLAENASHYLYLDAPGLVLMVLVARLLGDRWRRE